ncbi:uncharacterized protein LOC123515170 [Portunus trituberculatus]|uniref:uncharacterized protein LOC123515170 n=1 Tax=Portunus trituberculatus TaxID=210409 RepID=UPI001E1CC8CE|nr:uncharacterized protein LOC123515170 [Portunus trituberculatus]
MNYAAYSGKGRKMPGGEVQKTFKIFCGNLAGAATKDDLYYLFSRYGPVVEAVVMVGKFYGFVHMAYEEDGWKAICELRGYNLHGKTMAVEASINSKKATPLYKQNIIGKGITTLDDFNDYSSSKSKSAEGRERRPPPESFTSFNKPGESSIRPTNPPPPTNYYYHPAFPASASSSQPSPIGHTPPPMSRTSPRPELASLKTMESLQGRESPLLKMQAVDANSNPIQEHNTERLEGVSPCCNLCGSVFDEWQHKPKILSCGHTFCCNCLLCLAQDVEVKCPSGCPYTTALTDAGISGLTTNYTVPIKKLVNTSISPSLSGISSGFVLQNGAQRPSTSPSPMVCCSCPKIPAAESCNSNGHHLIAEDQARDIFRTDLKTSLEVTLKKLRQTMTLRATMKERLERTVLSVEKFLDELRQKVEGEQLEEAVLQEHLADLTMASEALAEGSSIYQLVESFNQVQNYITIITSQFNQCAAITAINNATEAIIVKLKQSALEPVLSSIGFSNEEAFSMNSSLEEHALFGNNANVLLLYMLSDLLSTRMLQLKGVSPRSPSQQPPLSAPSPLQSHLPPTPVSTNAVDDGSIGHSLGLPSNKMNELKSHEVEKMNELKSHEMNNINEHILQMTEAIETGSLLGRSDGMGAMSAGANVTGPNSVQSAALSLGLSNLSLIAAEASENGKDELESLGDRREPIPVSYLDAAKKPAKPSQSPDGLPKMHLEKLCTTLRPNKFPHCWMELSFDGEPAGRIVFELRPDKAPKMCENFIALCTGRSGYGYKGTHFFKSGEGFLAGGDVENDDGTGGYSAFEKRTFEADLCPLKDEVGMVRFKGIGTSDKGRGMVGSQFMIWCGDRDFKKFSYSLVFGKVVDGLDVAKKAAAVNVHRVSVEVEKCGAI